MAYFSAVSALCGRMLPSFAVALGMAGDFSAQFFAGEPNARLRLLHYPPEDTTRLRPEAAFGQQFHNGTRPDRRARALSAAAQWRVDCSPGHSGNASDKSRQRLAAVVQ
jgi:hypothetical protein